ncbi:hypothetical protein VNO77_11071 [Canavalia gladiata]|uniref:Uncharacterized protein n=1 Tax=Canavalia gladiata TaxID=3824 RepID=A0AAN9MB39_CANGL
MSETLLTEKIKNQNEHKYQKLGCRDVQKISITKHPVDHFHRKVFIVFFCWVDYRTDPFVVAHFVHISISLLFATLRLMIENFGFVRLWALLFIFPLEHLPSFR